MNTSRAADDGDGELSTAVAYRLSELKVSVDGDEYAVPLDREVIRIGRGKGNDIVLKDSDLSFVHCEIWPQRDHYVLIDNDTDEGTFVNGNEVEFYVLEPGDEIQVGDAVLVPVEPTREETPEPLEPDEAEALFSERSDNDSGSNKKKANGVAKRKTTPSARSVVRSSTKIWAVVLLLLVGLTSFAGYSYYQYTNTESARELLRRAELLKNGHEYQRALDVISNQLLERYPSSDVASAGRTLQSSIRTIINHEKRVRSDFREINASVPPPESLPIEERFERYRQTLDQLEQLLARNDGFLKRRFGPSSDPEQGPALLYRMKQLRTELESRLETMTTQIYQQQRKTVRKRVKQREFRQAVDIATSFDQKYGEYRGEDEPGLAREARRWIYDAYVETRNRAFKQISTDQGEQAIEEYKTTMDPFQGVISQKRLTSDLQHLRKQLNDERPNEGGESASTPDRASRERRGASVIIGDMAPDRGDQNQQETD